MAILKMFYTHNMSICVCKHVIRNKPGYAYRSKLYILIMLLWAFHKETETTFNKIAGMRTLLFVSIIPYIH